jgi:hypothetical protein
MSNSATMMLPEIDSVPQKDVHWFAGWACVERGADGRCRVYVGGRLIGEFGPRERAIRNTLVLGLSLERAFRKGKLAEAFGITDEHLRRIRRRYEAQGEAGIPRRGPGGSAPKADAKLRERLSRQFDEGLTAAAVKRADRGLKISYATVLRVWHEWERSKVAATAAAAGDAPVAQGELFAPTVVAAPEPSQDAGDESKSAPVRGARDVRHLGAWILLGLLEREGVYEAAHRECGGEDEWPGVRLALDAVVAALALGQGCVEGVRRLEAPSAGILLRARAAPSESWVRRVLKRFVDDAHGARLMLHMMGRYLSAAAAETEQPAVYYVDNHLRRYTGQYTTRRGWRMQDKRVVPGCTDYFVHDEDGRAVFRFESPDHAPLTDWLSPIARVLRMGLGPKQRILVAFDRAGAYPAQLAALRDEGFEFVTYERRPYPLLATTAFTETIDLGDEKYGLHEERLRNLGRGRGRVRRIALLTPEGQQVNLLAASKESAPRLVGVMSGRWVQENAFKHGTERWGINQLDRRKVEHYPPETVIPNPARRRLDRALRLARVVEGEARRELARMTNRGPVRWRWERILAEAIAEQERLEALRPSTPTHAPLAETELAGKLVYHPGEYKTLLDTLRIACANAESELAATLAPHLRRPREAKKALANLFAAPGRVRLAPGEVHVTLAPVGRDDELEAFPVLCAALNQWALVLPGDPKRRLLRFRSQLQ